MKASAVEVPFWSDDEVAAAMRPALEHIVDTVLYFEGENSLDHRVLRATKNRFGSVDEIGVFRMAEDGLAPVANPSELFLGDRSMHASGSAVTALLEGTRPVLIEVQALAAKAGFGTPQRVATGYDGRPGVPPAMSAREIREQWSAAIGRGALRVLDGGTLAPSEPSTVVDCTGRAPRVVRPGAISAAVLRETAPRLIGDA